MAPWGLIALCWVGCALVTDFDFRPDGAGGATGATTGTTTGVGGGEGGAGGAACSDHLDTDPNNCGECGFVCGGEEPCVDGACFQCIDLDGMGGTLDRVVVDVVDGGVYFVQHADPAGGGGAGGGGGDGGGPKAYIRRLPLRFESTTSPALGHPIDDGTGVTMMAVGPRVYVTGQLSTLIYACTMNDCSEFDVGPSGIVQMQGMTAIDGVLYFLSSANKLFSVPLDGGGSPKGTPTQELSTYAEPIANAGVIELFQTLEPKKRLYWGSYDVEAQGNGCLYRVDLDDLPVPQSPGQPCYTAKFASQGFVVSPEGVIYAQDGPTTIRKIEGEPPPMETVFDSNASAPRGLDESYLYVKDATSGRIRAIPLAGGPSVTAFTQVEGSLYGLDTQHPRYVVGTSGTKLCRWPKPKP